MNTTIENAILISTNPAAQSVVYMDGYRSARVNANNVTFIGANADAPIFNMGSGGSGKGTLNLTDCAISGAAPAVVTTKITAVTYNGTTLAANPEDLAVIYGTAPADLKLAYSTATLNGSIYSFVGYYGADAPYVTIYNANLGTEQRYIVGSLYELEAAEVEAIKKIDDAWYYSSSASWSAKIGDEAISLDAITDAENAGKTVVIEAVGDYRLLYLTVSDGSETVYYCEEGAAAYLLNRLANPTKDAKYTIVLYADVETSMSDGMHLIGKTGAYASFYIDLNGYTWSLNKTNAARGSYAILGRNSSIYIYSTVAGGTLDTAKAANGIVCVDQSASIFFGEMSENAAPTYGKNLTVYCNALAATEIWSTAVSFIGGTYIKNSDEATPYFVDCRRTVPMMKNCTFIMKNVATFSNSMRYKNVENCNIISETPMQLFLPLGLPGFLQGKDSAGNPLYNVDIATTFTGCNFYNVIANVCEEIAVNYVNCKFSLASPYAQAGGFIAYTGAPETVKIGGKDYVFGAALLAADQVALVNWGFGITEYWAIGAVATHANTVIDGVFGYKFLPLEVEAGENKATAQLAAIKPGVLNMNLALQSSIIFNLAVSDALKGATVKIGGSDAVVIEGAAALRFAIAPNVANQSVNVVITIGEKTHTIGMNIADYAKQIVANAKYEQAHNLVYAMVDYVRAMTGDDTFCGDLTLAYEKKTLTAEASKNEGTLLESIAFQLDDTIAIAVQGANAVGKEVVLTLATGRIERATVGESGIVIFEDLYVNEFNGEMTLTVDDESYDYSLANYLHGIGGESAAVQALYNYAFYAQEYVDYLNANKQ